MLLGANPRSTLSRPSLAVEVVGALAIRVARGSIQALGLGQGVLEVLEMSLGQREGQMR